MIAWKTYYWAVIILTLLFSQAHGDEKRVQYIRQLVDSLRQTISVAGYSITVAPIPQRAYVARESGRWAQKRLPLEQLRQEVDRVNNLYEDGFVFAVSFSQIEGSDVFATLDTLPDILILQDQQGRFVRMKEAEILPPEFLETKPGDRAFWVVFPVVLSSGDSLESAATDSISLVFTGFPPAENITFSWKSPMNLKRPVPQPPGRIKLPVFISGNQPVYPRKARREGITGVVAVEFFVETNGTVREAVVLSGPEVFHSAALKAVKSFKFEPGLSEEGPVRAKMSQEIRFNLNQ